MTEQWQEIFFSLNGTCQTLDQVLEQYNAIHLLDNDEFLTELDNEIFLCEQCGWWDPTYLQSESGVCEDCYQDNE